MRPLAVLCALLAGCAAGPRPLPASAVEHIASAQALPDDAFAVDCEIGRPCSYTTGTWYPSPLAAHMAGAERCCTDCIKELKKADRAGVDTLTIVLSAIGGGLLTGFAVAAGYEVRDLFRK